jgi:hypothetical protein
VKITGYAAYIEIESKCNELLPFDKESKNFYLGTTVTKRWQFDSSHLYSEKDPLKTAKHLQN